jgi:hypothetical protein
LTSCTCVHSVLCRCLQVGRMICVLSVHSLKYCMAPHMIVLSNVVHGVRNFHGEWALFFLLQLRSVISKGLQEALNAHCSTHDTVLDAMAMRLPGGIRHTNVLLCIWGQELQMASLGSLYKTHGGLPESQPCFLVIPTV